MLAYSDTLITSSEQLKAEILPLDSHKLSIMYGEKVWYSQYCRCEKEILTYFLDGSIPVPFSGVQLLKVCRKNTKGSYEHPYMKDSCRDHCTDFVFDYMKEVAEKEDTGVKNLWFDVDVLSAAMTVSRYRFENAENAFQDAVLDGELKEPFSVKRLRDICRNNTPVAYETQCTSLATEYEKLYKLNHPEKQ